MDLPSMCHDDLCTNTPSRTLSLNLTLPSFTPSSPFQVDQPPLAQFHVLAFLNFTIILFRRDLTILCPTLPPQYIRVIASRICAPLDPLVRPRRAPRSETQTMSTIRRLHAHSGGATSTVSAEPLRRCRPPGHLLACWEPDPI